MPVIDTGKGQMDVISRLLKDRILLLGQQVDDEVANVLVAQLLYLANEDPEKDITLYINSPGGSVSAGMVRLSCFCCVCGGGMHTPVL
jgi:ATP-dependent Clp endopeptidase proteolytic subunit ClpP